MAEGIDVFYKKYPGGMQPELEESLRCLDACSQRDFLITSPKTIFSAMCAFGYNEKGEVTDFTPVNELNLEEGLTSPVLRVLAVPGGPDPHEKRDLHFFRIWHCYLGAIPNNLVPAIAGQLELYNNGDENKKMVQELSSQMPPRFMQSYRLKSGERIYHFTPLDTEEGVNRIGRRRQEEGGATANEICIPAAGDRSPEHIDGRKFTGISGCHAVIKYGDGNLQIADCNSRNGTYVSGISKVGTSYTPLERFTGIELGSNRLGVCPETRFGVL